MKIWLIRHGLTALGEEKRYQGALDTPLSPGGREALLPAEFTMERVYVSPARRAMETAEILFPASVRIPVPGLREMDFGAFEGRGWWEMNEDTDYRAWVEGGCLEKCPGGEDRGGFSTRTCEAFGKILEKENDSAELVIIAHGGTQMALLERYGEPERTYYEWQRPCGCGWLLEWVKERGQLRVLREVDFRK